MKEQPTALRLADELEMWTLGEPAAAELRRLSAEHEEDQRVIAVWRGRTQRAEAQRDALLEALRPFVTIGSGFDMDDILRARAAIKAVEEGK